MGGIVYRLLIATAVFAIALDGGSYSIVSRQSLTVAVWWAILIGVATGILPRGRLGRGAILTTALLLAFALWTAASIGWSTSAERALLEFDRAAIYLGVYLLVLLGLRSDDAPRFCDGVAIGTGGIVLVSLASRFFPDLLPAPDIPRFLPSAATRLAYPVNYWNALAILLGLALPFLLRAATHNGSEFWRGAALGVVPALVATVYLTSSRGGAATIVVAAIIFVALTSRRWAAAAALLVAALGSGMTVVVLTARSKLVDGPLESAAALDQGRSAALLILIVCLLTGGAYGLGCRYLKPPERTQPALGWGIVAATTLTGVVLLAAADPVDRFEAFKAPPSEIAGQPTLQEHLLSAGGSGRWQFWAAAVDEFRSRPLTGRGAGSYEAWWAQHGSLSYFVRDAHSLYLETLGELGLVGFVLLAAALLLGLVASVHAVPGRRSALAAPAAAAGAFCFAAGIDWIWEVPAVSILGFASLGILGAPSSAASARLGGALRVAGCLACAAVICAAGIPLLASLEVRSSHEAARSANLAQARAHALRARDIEPWASSPYEQLALVAEEQGDVRAARDGIDEALERDAGDWRLWLIAARIETKLGDVAAARQSLFRAIRLNPRSPVFRRTE